MIQLKYIHRVGDNMDMTKTYSTEEFNQAYILDTIKQVIAILNEKGYNPINQIVGYLMSGDPGYITNYKNARNMLVSIERVKVLEVLVKETVK